MAGGGPILKFDVEIALFTRGMMQLNVDLATRVKAASEITAAAVVREAQGRVARRTGKTAEGIHYEESRDGLGYVVLAMRAERAGVPFWLEFGTRYMTARPFLYASAAIEKPGHERRIEEAVEQSITLNGFRSR